tara:strand:- start:327 stop:920 length:594 start_codon:yes stop_codon:yes gene_type:complete
MIKLGITGGIASGKTTASEFLSKKKCYVFNADKESKKHLKKSLTLQKKIISIFGRDIAPNNKIDLSLLAQVAFKNEINHSILNGIMWPEIFLIINREYDKIKSNKKIKFFVVDAALIYEANFTSFFDYTILITATEKTRLQRAIKRHNISLENIQNRISLQMPDIDKKKISDFIINNNFSLNHLYKELEILYNNLLK